MDAGAGIRTRDLSISHEQRKKERVLTQEVHVFRLSWTGLFKQSVLAGLVRLVDEKPSWIPAHYFSYSFTKEQYD